MTDIEDKHDHQAPLPNQAADGYAAQQQPNGRAVPKKQPAPPIENNQANTAAQKKQNKLLTAQSPGEKIFNTATYQVVGTLGTAAVSIYLADLFENGKGKPLFDSVAKKIGPPLAKMRGLDNPKQSIEMAQAALVFSALFWGGTLLTYPVKKLEDHKDGLVQWADDKYNSYFTPTPHTLEIQEATRKRLADEASPSWGNLLLARGLITATIAAVVFTLAGRDKTTADKLAQQATETMAKSENKTIQAWGKSERSKGLLSTSLIDLYQSTIGGVVLYMTTHKYKSMQKAKHASNDNQTVEAALTQAPATAKATTTPTHGAEESEPQTHSSASPHLHEVDQVSASAHSRKSHEPQRAESKNIKNDWQGQFEQPKDHSDKIIEMKSAQSAIELGSTL